MLRIFHFQSKSPLKQPQIRGNLSEYGKTFFEIRKITQKTRLKYIIAVPRAHSTQSNIITASSIDYSNPLKTTRLLVAVIQCSLGCPPLGSSLALCFGIITGLTICNVTLVLGIAAIVTEMNWVRGWHRMSLRIEDKFTSTTLAWVERKLLLVAWFKVVPVEFLFETHNISMVVKATPILSSNLSTRKNIVVRLQPEIPKAMLEITNNNLRWRFSLLEYSTSFSWIHKWKRHLLVK